MQTALVGALDEAAARDACWRRAPPRDHLEYMGVQHADASGDEHSIAQHSTA
jgi:hypothetical protein